ncbi:Na-translocating system protein MpsC family protein [Patulibacter sp. NPDC049589]|uniref:Na-translocating system protein MpsC family protein n=1 Tax=Patulibacter sp. NPDC049589 TaxID=3154731 RepID=UPI003416FDD1
MPFSVPQQEISNGIAQLYKEHLGRGPTSVKTVVIGDQVVCVLEDTSTPYEATLKDLDGGEIALRARSLFQHQARAAMTEIVEVALGRTVRAHIPGYSIAADAAVEVFLLTGEAVPPSAAST